MSKLENALLDFISEKQDEIASQEMAFVIDAFREQFDNMQSVVRLFRKNKNKKGFEKGAYATISEILSKQGIRKKDGNVLSVSQVCRYMNIVRAEKKAESKRKPVAVVAPVVQAVAVPELVARPGAVPGATKPVVAPAPVGGFDAIPEKITGYDPMKKLQEWEKSKSFIDQWDDDDEILYGQLRRWVFKFANDVSGQNVVGVCRKQFPNQTGFSKSLADTVELLFKQREKHKGHAHWTM